MASRRDAAIRGVGAHRWRRATPWILFNGLVGPALGVSCFQWALKIAPTGVVNAGDAGIGAAGNLNIAAPQVVGLDNIQVGGISAGVPTDSGAAAGLTGVSSLSSSVASAAESAAVADAGGDPDASLADEALGWLEVFIEGFGDGDEDEDDEDRRRNL